MINKILKSYKNFETNYNSFSQTKFILETLYEIILSNVDGDIIDMGCNEGVLLYNMNLLLNELNNDKILYGVDSFQGLPNPTQFDIVVDGGFKFGDMVASVESVKQKFVNTKEPKILKGFFKDIPIEQYPDKISFAHLDGDFYQSILDSFEIIYPKVSNGGVIIVDDYGYNKLPGVKKATDLFLKDKNGIGYTLYGKYVFWKNKKRIVI